MSILRHDCGCSSFEKALVIEKTVCRWRKERISKNWLDRMTTSLVVMKDEVLETFYANASSTMSNQSWNSNKLFS